MTVKEEIHDRDINHVKDLERTLQESREANVNLKRRLGVSAMRLRLFEMAVWGPQKKRRKKRDRRNC